MTHRAPVSAIHPVGSMRERVVVRELGDGMRLVLELDRPESHPITLKFVRHIDRVRALLLRGKVSPDDAHAMLIDCTWVRR